MDKKKIAILLLLIFSITTSAYAVGLVDTLTCKKVFLHLIKRVVLVKYLTGEVKYTLTTKKTWVLLTGPVKAQYQSIYNAQVTRR
jgi:hypothetical protein